MTDPIADFLSRIRNALSVHHSSVNIPASNILINISQLLKDHGFINDFSVIPDNKQNTISISLKYLNRQPVISGLKRVSRPGLRVYAKSSNLPRVLSGLGVAIISTSNGILSDSQARKSHLGGEVLAFVW